MIFVAKIQTFFCEMIQNEIFWVIFKTLCFSVWDFFCQFYIPDMNFFLCMCLISHSKNSMCFWEKRFEFSTLNSGQHQDKNDTLIAGDFPIRKWVYLSLYFFQLLSQIKTFISNYFHSRRNYKLSCKNCDDDKLE